MTSNALRILRKYTLAFLMRNTTLGRGLIFKRHWQILAKFKNQLATVMAAFQNWSGMYQHRAQRQHCTDWAWCRRRASLFLREWGNFSKVTKCFTDWRPQENKIWRCTQDLKGWGRSLQLWERRKVDREVYLPMPICAHSWRQIPLSSWFLPATMIDRKTDRPMRG